MKRPRTARLGRDTRGAIYVEYAVIFLMVFFAFFYMVQVGITYSVTVVVKHAATKAARAFMVVWDDDVCRYVGEARKFADADSGATAARDPLQPLLNAVGESAGNGNNLGIGFRSLQSPRMDAVYAAASVPLLAFAPDGTTFNETFWTADNATLIQAIGGTPADRFKFGADTYNRCYLMVSWIDQAGVAQPLTRAVTTAGPVTIRVTYLSYCTIPYAASFFCKTYNEALAQAPELNNIARGTTACGAIAPTAGRFIVHRAESTISLRDAQYVYEAEPASSTVECE